MPRALEKENKPKGATERMKEIKFDAIQDFELAHIFECGQVFSL